MPNYVWAQDKDECLSPGGGNHIEIFADDEAILEAVTSGDFVKYNEMYGVALTDYNSDTDSFMLDISGGHEVSVLAQDGSGNSAVGIGD